MKNYLTSNAKLKQDGIFSWGIPAYKSADGFRTCPGAKDCLKGCYARQGFYVMPSVKLAQEERLALARSGAFVDILDAEIKKRKIKRVRIHDSGDFFSRDYRDGWLTIMQRNPNVTFYAYTKMIKIFKNCEVLPDNFHVIYSEGGKWDSMINRETMGHSRVFDSHKALLAAGYSDAHKRDLPALQGLMRVGLVYHGAKSKQWQTERAVNG